MAKFIYTVKNNKKPKKTYELILRKVKITQKNTVQKRPKRVSPEEKTRRGLEKMWKTIRDRDIKIETRDKRSNFLADKIGTPKEKFIKEIDEEV